MKNVCLEPAGSLVFIVLSVCLSNKLLVLIVQFRPF